MALKLKNTNKLILQRRDFDTPHSPGLLVFFGRQIEEGKEPQEAAIRELGGKQLSNKRAPVIPESVH